MSFLVCKPHDLIFDGWAISRANPLDDSAVEGRSIEAALNDLMGRGVCVGDVAGDLIRFDLFSREGEWNGMFISVLRDQSGEINGMAVESRGGPRLEPPHPETQSTKRFRKTDRGWVAHST